MALPFHLPRRARRRGLDRYLLDGEQIVTASHHHWARLAVPFLSVAAGLILVLLLDSTIPANLALLADLLWWAWFVVVGWAVWELLKWRHDWFVATDKRLILTYGLVTSKVGMMPLAKVTDMSYTRSPMGRLLGYGTFVMESAGLDQALRRVRWVANPDHTYRVICAEMFEVEDRERVLETDEHGHRLEDGPPAHTPGLYAGYVPPEERTGPIETPGKAGQSERSTSTPISYAASRRDVADDAGSDADPWHQGPELSEALRREAATHAAARREAATREAATREAATREADTGPIPYRRPPTDEGEGWRPTTDDD